jgi:hypothetical protein
LTRKILTPPSKAGEPRGEGGGEDPYRPPVQDYSKATSCDMWTRKALSRYRVATAS